MMKTVLIGTGNEGKVQFFKNLLGDLPVELISPDELGLKIDVEETAETVEANVRIKALAYHSASDLPTLSVDSALHIEGLSADQQPGGLRKENFPQTRRN